MGNDQLFCGFGNHFQSEAIDGALPKYQNSPQKVTFGLYAEQINGSAFTCPRTINKSTWAYRILPSVVHTDYTLYKHSPLFEIVTPANPTQVRSASLFEKNNIKLSFADGLIAVAANAVSRILTYEVNETQGEHFFCNHDGEFLFVAQHGHLLLETEFGQLTIKPGEIAVIPKGITFQALGHQCYGYICESLTGHYRLPELGPIGANGLAAPQHFLYPKAAFVNKEINCCVITLYQNHLWEKKLTHHPFNVVAWKGNYLPYKYDLTLFNTINTVSFDHPDPSIFTVLTVPSPSIGTAHIDFVIFPERWMVAEHTFRPPYYHKNCMSEFMGLIYGQYDAKKEGFKPGGFSIHNAMAAHGPDADTFAKASTQHLENEKYKNTLAFMFESDKPWNITQNIERSSKQDKNYLACWQSLSNNFNE